jgi:hypothetical protein
MKREKRFRGGQKRFSYRERYAETAEAQKV